jgi:hypothetical protein
MKRAIREPLVVMLLCGAALFALYRVARPRSPGRRIEVSAEVVRGLRADHARRTGKPPTAEEERALVRRFVESEALYREALALGLDRGDVIVRRRLVQKMELFAGGAERTAEPDEAALRAWFEAHRDAYRAVERVSFEQQLASGEPFAHGRVFTAKSEREIDALFGPGFGAQVSAAADGEQVEATSSYGKHRVRVTARQRAEVVPFEAVRAAVRRDVIEAERVRREREAVAAVVGKYQVVEEGR